MHRKNFYRIPLFLFIIVFFTALTGTNALFGSGLSPGKTAGQFDEKTFLKKYKSAHRFFLKGKDLFLKGKYPASQKKMEKGLEIMPRHPQCRYFLARIQYLNRAYSRALDHIQRAKNDFEFLAAMVERHNKQKAQRLKRQKKELDDYYLEVQNGISSNAACGSKRLSGISGKSAEIDGKLNRSLESGPRLPAGYSYIHGNILFKLKQYPAAREQYRRAIAADPGYADAYNNLANLFYMGKKFPEALACLREAEKNGVSVHPRLKEALLLIPQKSVQKKQAVEMSPITSGKPGAVQKGLGRRPMGIMRFNVTVANGSSENTYVVFHKESGDALIIDPGAEDPRIHGFIDSAGLTVKKILNTHGHHDHIGGNRYYAERYRVKIAAHEADRPFYTGDNLENKPHEFFNGPDHTLRCGSLTVTALHTPGHSPGSVCYHIGGYLLSGDTLFNESVGRTWGRTEAEKRKKLELQISHIKSKLLTLPDFTPVYPGHGPSTTIGDEKSFNLYLK